MNARSALAVSLDVDSARCKGGGGAAVSEAATTDVSAVLTSSSGQLKRVGRLLDAGVALAGGWSGSGCARCTAVAGRGHGMLSAGGCTTELLEIMADSLGDTPGISAGSERSRPGAFEATTKAIDCTCFGTSGGTPAACASASFVRSFSSFAKYEVVSDDEGHRIIFRLKFSASDGASTIMAGRSGAASSDTNANSPSHQEMCETYQTLLHGCTCLARQTLQNDVQRERAPAIKKNRHEQFRDSDETKSNQTEPQVVITMLNLETI